MRNAHVKFQTEMKIFGNRTASGAVSDFKRDPSSRPQRDSGLLFVPAIPPRRRGDPAKSGMRRASGPPAARYSGGQTIKSTARPRAFAKLTPAQKPGRVLNFLASRLREQARSPR